MEIFQMKVEKMRKIIDEGQEEHRQGKYSKTYAFSFPLMLNAGGAFSVHYA